MEYEVGTRLDLILSNQRALEEQIKELNKKVNALLLKSGQFRRKAPERKVEVPVEEIGNPEESEVEESQEGSSDLDLSKHAPPGGKWKVAE